MSDKPIYWLSSAKDDLADFPEEARRKAGFQLRAVQRGRTPTDFKPMPSVSKGVEEIRIRTEDAYRVFYVARFEEAVYVLSLFHQFRQRSRINLPVALGRATNL